MGTSRPLRRLKALAVVVLTLAASAVALLLTPQVASATTICGVVIVTPPSSPYPPAAAHISLDPYQTKPGAKVHLTASGFKSKETIKICMRSVERSLGTVTTDTSGNASADITVPTDAEVGNHTIYAVGTQSTVYDTAVFTVVGTVDNPPSTTPSPTGTTTTTTDSGQGGGLPVTGIAIGGLLLAALIALLVGSQLSRKAKNRHNRAF